MFLQTVIEILSNPFTILTIAFLVAAGWLMERIITRMALLCRSVHVVHVPWGICCIIILAYLNGFIDYKAVVAIALFFLISYPSMWYLNYRFSRDLEQILRDKRVTHENVGFIIWPDEVTWIRYLKRNYHKVVRRKLDAETIDWILNYDDRNGFSTIYGHPVSDKTRDN